MRGVLFFCEAWVGGWVMCVCSFVGTCLGRGVGGEAGNLHSCSCDDAPLAVCQRGRAATYPPRLPQLSPPFRLVCRALPTARCGRGPTILPYPSSRMPGSLIRPRSAGFNLQRYRPTRAKLPAPECYVDTRCSIARYGQQTLGMCRQHHSKRPSPALLLRRWAQLLRLT